MGVDFRASPAITAGAVLAYGDTSAHLTQDAMKSRTQEILGSILGQYLYRGAGYLNGSVSFGGLNFQDIQRQLGLGDVARRVEHAETNGNNITNNRTTGWWFGFDHLCQSLKVSPYVSAHYERVRVGAYRENGADSTAITFGGQTREALVGEAGLRVQATNRIYYLTISPFVQMAYDHDGDAHRRSIIAAWSPCRGRSTCRATSRPAAGARWRRV